MSSRQSLLVLISSLAIVFPWPVYVNGVGFLPALKLLLLVVEQESPALGLQLLLQAVLALAACYFFGLAYMKLSQNWPIKIRGSVVGIISLSLIFILSTVALYKPINGNDEIRLEFREVYYW